MQNDFRDWLLAGLASILAGVAGWIGFMLRKIESQNAQDILAMQF